MKKFQFSLQSVLNLREEEEKSARAELGRRTSECEQIKEKMRDHVHLLDRFADSNVGDIDWTAYQEMSDFIRTQNHRLSVTLEGAEEKRKEALGAYHNALNRKKIFEKLKERQKEEFLRIQKEKENKMTDDLFSSRETYKRSIKK